MSEVPEMVERVARAICSADGRDYDHLVIRRVSGEPDQSDYDRLARAAIEAMREPTPEMEASWGEDDYYESHSLKLRTWHQMIAAAFGEKQ